MHTARKWGRKLLVLLLSFFVRNGIDFFERLWQKRRRLRSNGSQRKRGRRQEHNTNAYSLTVYSLSETKRVEGCRKRRSECQNHQRVEQHIQAIKAIYPFKWISAIFCIRISSMRKSLCLFQAVNECSHESLWTNSWFEYDAKFWISAKIDTVLIMMRGLLG